MKNVNINVTGMVCEGCEKRIINALSLIEGITNIKASHVDNLVTFSADSNVSIDEVKETIVDLGFEIK